MWIMTANGFLSAVEHRDNTNMLLVRSRTDEALVYLCEQMNMSIEDIEYNENADYLWRLEVSKETFAEFLAIEVLNNIKYDNFKDHAKKKGAATRYLNFLHDVWYSGLDLQDVGLYKRIFGGKKVDHDDEDVWDEWEEDEDGIWFQKIA